MAEKLNIDIDELEKAYRSGVKSLRNIAKDFGISEAVIRKYANNREWSRDLSARIKAKAEEIVRNTAVRESVRTDLARITENEIIKSSAELQAGAILEESEEIKRLKRLSDGFELELAALSDAEMDLEKRTRVLKSLTDIKEKIINLRRRNLGINDNSNGEADKEPITEVVYRFVDPT